MTVTLNHNAIAFKSIEDLAAAWKAAEGRFLAGSRQGAERRGRLVADAIKCGLPNTRQEEWKYTSIRPLLESGFNLLPVAEVVGPDERAIELARSRLISGATPIVFVDGVVVVGLPNVRTTGLEYVRILSEVEASEDASWWDQWHLKLDAGKVFWRVNLGFSSDGVVLEVPRGLGTTPVFHIMHIATNKRRGDAFNNRVLVSVGEESAAHIYEEFLTVDHDESLKPAWTNALTQLHLGPRANCGYYRVLASQGSFHTGAVSVRLDRASRMETFSLAAGGRLARVDVQVEHSAGDSECVMAGLSLLRGREHADHHTAVDHVVGRTQTTQLYKGILADEARNVFNGKIFIRKDAQKSEAYQTSKNLLLSPKAEADVKPQLEIDADDVKASHGAAIGSLDPTELFYLQSRCISRAEATAMLCRGFAAETVNRLTDPTARALLMSRVSDWFAGLVADYPGKLLS